MINEEKAREIAQLCNGCTEGNPSHSCYGCSHCEERGVYCGAIELAAWKDEYYKKLLNLLIESGADADIITNYIKNCIEL